MLAVKIFPVKFSVAITYLYSAINILFVKIDSRI